MHPAVLSSRCVSASMWSAGPQHLRAAAFILVICVTRLKTWGWNLPFTCTENTRPPQRKSTDNDDDDDDNEREFKIYSAI